VRDAVPGWESTEAERILDTLATPVVVWGFDGMVAACNAAATVLFGYSREQMRTLSRSAVVHPEDLEGAQTRADARKQGDRTRWQFAQRIVTADGVVRQCACSASPYVRDGEVVGAVVEYLDGERLEAAGGAFARSAALFRELFELSPVAVFSTGPEGRFEMVNPTARLLLQRPIEELEALTPAEVVAPEYAPRLQRLHLPGANAADQAEVQVVRPDGSTRWVHLSLRSWSGPDGRVAGQVGLAQDVTQQVMERQAAESAARRDALTGALNRRAFDERLAAPPPLHTAVAVVDLNDFKSINDRYGHGVGDEALLAVAQSLEAVDGVEVYRTGGDEFAVVAPGWPAARLERALPRIVPVPGRALRASLAVGAAVVTAGTSIAAAVEVADQRMYRAKRARQAALRRSA